jgi:hypothetical protein
MSVKPILNNVQCGRKVGVLSLLHRRLDKMLVLLWRALQRNVEAAFRYAQRLIASSKPPSGK